MKLFPDTNDTGKVTDEGAWKLPEGHEEMLKKNASTRARISL